MSEPLSGAALNRAIAERLGWRVAIEVVHNPVTGDQTATRVYEGERLRWQVFQVLRDAIVWDTVIFAGDGYLPDWANDAGAAMVDLMSVGCSLSRTNPHQWPGEWECSSTPLSTEEYPPTITAYGNTPAEAICRWFLML